MLRIVRYCSAVVDLVYRKQSDVAVSKRCVYFASTRPTPLT
ncbi:hypothetical protein NBRC111894_1776 [Sporolactobacillus inulinus]|uniref:Uncharacterized protein n=1 Tax=Sporolactobacillus inulinus TaxID=2078 RepID=A0A4Y1ZAX9_9BACL|nr:hypothetical protein NBRC111894_1776 [Sporolactobacillus inulinus]